MLASCIFKFGFDRLVVYCCALVKIYLCFVQKFILLVLENHGTPVISCALDVCETEILFEQYSVPPTLELLWSELVQTELPICCSS